MAYSYEEIGARARQRNPQAFEGFTDAQIGERIAQRNPQVQTLVADQQKGATGVAGVGVGAIKRTIDQPRQFAESGGSLAEKFAQTKVGQKIAQGIGKGAQKFAQTLWKDPAKQQFFFDTFSSANRILDKGTEQPEFTAPQSQAEKTGGVVADVGMYLLPGGMTSKGAKGLQGTKAIQSLGKAGPVASRAITEGVAGATIGLGQTGDVNQATNIGLADAGIVAGLGAISPVLRGAGRIIRPVRKATTAVPPVGSMTPAPAVPTPTPGKVQQFGQAIAQTTSDIAQRVPRVIRRTKEAIEESATKRQRIAQSAPAVKKAIQAGLDERFINTVQASDNATNRAYKEMLDIAESKSPTLQLKKRPSTISGNFIAEQYDLADKQRREIGKRLGEAVKDLSKYTKINLSPAYDQMLRSLRAVGITGVDDKGKLIVGAGRSITDQELAKIQNLFDLATESGAKISPYDIYQKDKLFSKLQREARFEGIGDILIDTPEGPRSVFSVFRDIFSNALDDVSTADIRSINSEYRALRTLIDDVEDSIFKTPNFNITKNVNPAEFAKINLRRILTEAQSAEAYSAIAEKLDATARALGYAGPKPTDLIAFAEELKKLYPNTIPSASFSGGIRLGVGGIADIAQKAFELGAPKIADQQKALRELLESVTGVRSSKSSIQTPISIKDFPRQKLDSPELEKIQEDSIEYFANNRGRLAEEYQARFGNVVNVDDARELFRPIGYDGLNASAVHEASSALAKDVYSMILSKTDKPDVVFLAGGAGSGKTSVIGKLVGQEDDVGLVFDGTLSNYDSTMEKINEAISLGKRPIVRYVYRDLVDSWINGVVKRAKRTGRVVPIEFFFDAHQGSMDTIKRLAKEGVMVKVYDNSLGEGLAKEITLDTLALPRYTKNVGEINSLKQRAYEQTESIIKKENLDPKMVERLLPKRGIQAKGAKKLDELPKGPQSATKPRLNIGNSFENKAKQYSSFEEFAKSQESVYHATSDFPYENIKNKGFRLGYERENPIGQSAKGLGEGIYFGPSEKDVAHYGENIVEAFISPTAKIKNITREELAKLPTNPAELTEYFKGQGFDGVKNTTRGEIVVFDPKNVLTRWQLEKLWKKARS